MTAVLPPPLIVTTREERRADAVVRWVTVDGISTFFEVRGVNVPPVAVVDYALLATIFYGMRAGRPLHVAGPVSRVLLRNLEEFQEAWAAWRPSDYRVISVTAEQVVSEQADPDERTGVFAFSGGVDATFALMRHQDGRAGLRSITPVAAVLVHGFDIPLESVDDFETVQVGARAMLQELEVPLALVATNWRKQLCRSWTMEYVTGLAACLHQFTGTATFGVFGAGEDYAHLQFPWSSNPVTNGLLSGGLFGLHTEGHGFTRTARVGDLCGSPGIAAKLRVCWEGQAGGRNCGTCEKCVRTKLNFMANGVEPLCFDRRPTLKEIRGLRARNVVQLDFLKEIVEVARRRGIEEPWVPAVERAIRMSRLSVAASVRRRVARLARPVRRRVRALVRRLKTPVSL